MGNKSSILRGRSDSEPIPSRHVQTLYGVLEGVRLINEENLQVDAFLGIPFAKPPLNELRFKKPEPPEPWKGVKKVVKFAPRAPQKDFFWNRWTKYPKSEDCLYLNVFSPVFSSTSDSDQGSKLPVMVYVHGGGFQIDSAANCGDIGICNNLCRQGVIVVTIQYRLGFLGFFSLCTPACPGNLGLWDQTMALNWIKENISAFNGDPTRLTILGQSAGGVSVDLLSLSPHSRDLFQQVIVMGGNAECAWGITSPQRIVNVCRRFASNAGWRPPSTENEDIEMQKYLRKKPSKIFERNLPIKSKEGSEIELDLAPVEDGDFFPKPINVLRKEVPIKTCMVGCCQYEALLFIALDPKRPSLSAFDKLLATSIPESKYSDYAELRRRARSLYLKNEERPCKRTIAEAYVNLYSDLFVNIGSYKYAKVMTENGHKVFVYSFNYYNPKSFGLLSFSLPLKGATHCTEITYIFRKSIVIQFKFNEQDEEMMKLMGKLWTNFAKYGNPNNQPNEPYLGFTWNPTDMNNPERCLVINEKCEMISKYCEGRCEFWAELYKRESSSDKSANLKIEETQNNAIIT